MRLPLMFDDPSYAANTAKLCPMETLDDRIEAVVYKCAGYGRVTLHERAEGATIHRREDTRQPMASLRAAWATLTCARADGFRINIEMDDDTPSISIVCAVDGDKIVVRPADASDEHSAAWAAGFNRFFMWYDAALRGEELPTMVTRPVVVKPLPVSMYFDAREEYTEGDGIIVRAFWVAGEMTPFVFTNIEPVPSRTYDDCNGVNMQYGAVGYWTTNATVTSSVMQRSGLFRTTVTFMFTGGFEVSQL